MRVFTRIRELISTHKDILLKLEQIEKQWMYHGKRLKDHERYSTHLCCVEGVVESAGEATEKNWI